MLTGAGLMVSAPATAADSDRKQIALGGKYVTDVIADVRGGERKGVDWLGRADLTAEVDGALFGWEGASLFFDLMFTQGPDFSGDHVGDGQVVSNVQADRALRPFEAWLRVPIGDKAYLKSGLVDLNTEFDIQSVGALFLNSSHGVGPEFSQTGIAGPSIFPATSVAFVAVAERKGLTARVGFFDAVAGQRADARRVAVRFPGQEGALLIGEVDLGLGPKFTLQAGAWTYTSRFEAQSALGSDGKPRRVGSHGGYVMVETRNERPAGRAGWDGWVRIGAASAEPNPIGLYLGGGLVYGDERRKLGFSIAHARLGDPAIAAAPGATDRAETAFEATAEFRLSESLAVQPDLQYVINPGWEPSRRDAVVVGLRLRFDLAFN
jgi:porin